MRRPFAIPLRDPKPGAETESMILTPILREVENGWIEGRIKELPEVLTAAPTREQALEDLVDALREYVASLHEDGLPIPVRVEDAGEVELAAC
jgi:predicted RNase H-like HicB family nuclease